jgi:hypothetical protein
MSTDPPDAPAPPEEPEPPQDSPPPESEVSSGADSDTADRKEDEEKPTATDAADDETEPEPEYSGEDKARARWLRDDAAQNMLASADRTVHRAEAGRDNVQGDVNNNTFNLLARDLAALRRSISGPVDDAYLNHLLTVHVQNESSDALASEVTKHSVVMLAGRANTGRRHSALRALDELAHRARGPSPIHVVSTGTSLEEAVDNLQEGQSYVLDASGAEWAFHMDQATIWRLAQEVAQRDSRLVVLVDEPWLLDADLPQLIHHCSPDQLDVTRNHLRMHHPEPDRVLADARKFTQVNAWLRIGRGPAVAVSLATSIALWCSLDPPGGADPAAHDRGPQPASLHRKFALRQARSLLRQSDRERRDGWTPRSQSLVLASAVLDGQPLSSVIRAAEELRHRLTRAEVPDRPVGCDVFEAPLKHWLRHADITDEDVPSVVLNGEKGSWAIDPLVRLNDPMLATGILEAAWQDYDLLRSRCWSGCAISAGTEPPPNIRSPRWPSVGSPLWTSAPSGTRCSNHGLVRVVRERKRLRPGLWISSLWPGRRPRARRCG